MVYQNSFSRLLCLAGAALVLLGGTVGCNSATASGKSSDKQIHDSFKSAAEGKNTLPPEGQKALQDYLKKNQGKPGGVK